MERFSLNHGETLSIFENMTWKKETDAIMQIIIGGPSQNKWDSSSSSDNLSIRFRNRNKFLYLDIMKQKYIGTGLGVKSTHNQYGSFSYHKQCIHNHCWLKFCLYQH